MGTRYLAKSAAVLNEADRFENILNWELFATEQETRLCYDYQEGVKWRPGDFLYSRPGYITPCHVPGCGLCSYSEEGAMQHPEHVGNTVRPMFELLSEYQRPMRCDVCEVDWVDGDFCWMCGAEYPWVKSAFTQVDSFFDYRVLEVSVVGYSIVDELFEAMNRQFYEFVFPPQNSFSWSPILSQWVQDYILSDPNTRSVSPFEASSFQEPVWGIAAFFDPTISDNAETNLIWANLPSDWRDLKRTVPTPIMEEPTDFSNWNSATWTRFTQSSYLRS